MNSRDLSGSHLNGKLTMQTIDFLIEEKTNPFCIICGVI